MTTDTDHSQLAQLWRLGQLLGLLLRPLTWLTNPLLRRGLTGYAAVVVVFVLGAAFRVTGLGLLALGPALPPPLMLVAGLIGSILAILGGLGVGAVLITSPVWAVAGIVLREATRPAAAQQ